MSPATRLTPHLWIIAPLAALGFLLWMAAARLHRIDLVTNLVETEAVTDPASPTGYAGGLRKLIVPEHNNDSYQWIAQTQQMLAGGNWRVRHVDYDNAPAGRTVLTPSPYRWWLGLLAGLDHQVTGRPAGQAAEHAARYAGPALLAVLLLAVGGFTGWRFGALAGTVASAALVTLFPLGGSFLAGQPDDNGLALAAAIGSGLLLLAGINAPAGESRGSAPAWFIAAGVVGGLGVWVDVVRAIPFLAGIMLGAVIAAALSRRDPVRSDAVALPWRHWALAGALTCLVAHVVEYFPLYWGGWPARYVHPLHGLAWLGAGEVTMRLSAWMERGESPWRRRNGFILALAVLAVASVPLAWVLKGTHDFFTADPGALRLSDLPGSPAGLGPWAWLSHDGLSLMVAATCLPLVAIAPAVWLLFRRGIAAPDRTRCAVALGPVLVLAGSACLQLRWWSTLDAAVLVLLAALAASRSLPGARQAAMACAMVALVPGAALLGLRARAARNEAVTEGDVVALVERDLAHWLARRAGPGGAVVLAPPNLAASLYFHGGLPELGTPYWENKDGFLASVRIAAASSPDEAQAVARSRGVNYIVVPSWDNFLDEYARLGSDQVDHTLMASLHRWLPPRWLQPVPYQLPAVNGFEGQSVAIFEVVEAQDNATALSHLAEYFAEMNQPDQARAVAYTLERSFPADLGAAIARVLATRAAEDGPAFGRALDDLETALARGDDQNLTWDRRVSLAIALVEGRRFDQAREQARRCLADVSDPRLRSLTTVSLHRLLVMSRGFHLAIGDPVLAKLAQQLLPAELRER
ncbi:MAG TPA: hypothetical protein VHD61_11345 [Lacunisphaera sp.]|nr:hypothetical protein [Lacunisphaera sp.]